MSKTYRLFLCDICVWASPIHVPNRSQTTGGSADRSKNRARIIPYLVQDQSMPVKMLEERCRFVHNLAAAALPFEEFCFDIGQSSFHVILCIRVGNCCGYTRLSHQIGVVRSVLKELYGDDNYVGLNEIAIRVFLVLCFGGDRDRSKRRVRVFTNLLLPLRDEMGWTDYKRGPNAIRKRRTKDSIQSNNKQHEYTSTGRIESALLFIRDSIAHRLDGRWIVSNQ